MDDVIATSGDAMELIAQSNVMTAQIANGIETLVEAQKRTNNFMGLVVGGIVLIVVVAICVIVYKLIRKSTIDHIM